MPTTGTWKVLGSTEALTVDGDAFVLDWIPGYPASAAALPGGAPSGTDAGHVFSVIAANPNLYLDDATTPIDYATVPPGWTPDDAYTVKIGTWELYTGGSIRTEITTLTFDETVTPPPDVTAPTAFAATGMTLLALVAVMNWPVTFTLTNDRSVTGGSGNSTLIFGGGPDPTTDPPGPATDFRIQHGVVWLEGTYSIIDSWWKIPKTPCGEASKLVHGGTHTYPYEPYDPDDISAHPTPTILSVTPNHGRLTGGTAITITGSGFGLGATVTLDGVPATDVVVVSQFTLTATTPAHAGGSVAVIVTNVDGVSSS